ncbi:MAG: hypothetical protein HY794_17225 [Desulfarculus sp.]|nr:hypothetical protein [Desulfarculus sp.]
MRRLYRERHLLGLSVSQHPLAVMRPWLQGLGFITAQDLKGKPHGAPVHLAGEVVIVHTPPMRDGSRVFFTTIEDETGLVDLALFPRDQPRNAQVLLANPIVLVWGTLTRRGDKDSLITVRRVNAPPLRLPGKAKAAPRGE